MGRKTPAPRLPPAEDSAGVGLPMLRWKRRTAKLTRAPSACQIVTPLASSAAIADGRGWTRSSVPSISMPASVMT